MTPAYFVEVTADEANLRPHPSTDAPPVTAVARGTQLAVVGAPSAGWLPVTADAHAGWIAGELVTKLPRLVVDASDHSELGHADARAWLGLVAHRRYVGVILKATEAWGSTARWSVDGVAWFKARWPQLVTAAGARYGDSFFRGAYHFLIFYSARAVDQAHFYLRTVDAAGGWGDGDLIPIVDVERGSERGPNYHAAAATVIETVQAFVARVRAVTGQRVLMYGRGAMRDWHLRAEWRRLPEPGLHRDDAVGRARGLAARAGDAVAVHRRPHQPHPVPGHRADRPRRRSVGGDSR